MSRRTVIWSFAALAGAAALVEPSRSVAVTPIGRVEDTRAAEDRTNRADDPGSADGSPACYPNCDGSTIPPVLNVTDFICFLQRYAAGDPYANCDGSSLPPVLNVTDFTCFLQKFAAGCP